jgi:hypothetical protein
MAWHGHSPGIAASRGCTMRARWAATFAATALIVALCLPALADVVGVVRGTLLDLTHPVAGVVVTLTGADSLSATTDAAGRFAFPRVPFGRYTLHASTPDGPVDRSIDIATGTVVDLDLLSTRVIGSARATTTGVHGTPIAVNTVTAAQIATPCRSIGVAARYHRRPCSISSQNRAHIT